MIIGSDTNLVPFTASEWDDDTRFGAERQIRQRYYATAAITKGEWVVQDVSDTDRLGSAIVKVPASTTGTSTADDPTCVGIAAETVPAGSWVDVVMWGPFGDAVCDNSIPAKASLQIGSTTAGSCVEAAGAGLANEAGASQRRIGYTLGASGSGVADVFVTCLS